MAHPHNAHRQHHVEKQRVHHLTKGYARGGSVKHSDEAADRKLIKRMLAEHERKETAAEGHKSKHRMDRPKRHKGGRVNRDSGGVVDRFGKPLSSGDQSSPPVEARERGDYWPPAKISDRATKRAKGGRVKGNAKTIVNVITGGHPASGAVPPGPPMMPPAPPMGVAPAGPMPPPMAGKPPMPPPGPAGVPPGGPPLMPMRAKGGRVSKPHGSPVWNEGVRNGTQVQHTRGKGDLEQLSRGKPITYAKGGRVKTHGDPGGSDRLHFTAKEAPSAMGIYRADSNTTNERARGGRIEASDKIAPATKLPGGSGGGEARLVKAKRAKREYAGPIS